MSAPRGLIFIHIPKTAGITLQSIIVRQYPWQKHALFPNLPAMEPFKKLPQEKRNRHAVLRGHLDASLIDYAQAGLPVITFLRDPFRRVVSGYEYIKKEKTHKFYTQMAKYNYSLYEFLEGNYIPNFDNGQVRFLSGTHDEAFGKINEKHLQLAIHNLDHRIKAFGITERFDESLLHIASILGWKTPFYNTYNINHNYTPTLPLDERTKTKINECNLYDDQLYQYAAARLDKILSEYGEKFQEETTHFQQKNQYKNLWFKLTEPYFHFKIRN